jgi:hypothetical protein
MLMNVDDRLQACRYAGIFSEEGIGIQDNGCFLGRENTSGHLYILVPEIRVEITLEICQTSL